MALFEEMKQQGNWLFRYRGTLPVIILVVTLLVYLRELVQGAIPADHGNTDLILIAVSLAGLMIRVLTVGFAARNTSGRNTAGQVAEVVNTKGFYSMLRHPLYLGNFLMWLGLCLLTRDVYYILFFTALYWLYYERIMLAEEEFLRSKFGAPYENWASSTPAFIPALGKFSKPDNSFDWIKVIKSEKSGVLALFTVFALFQIAGEVLVDGKFTVQDYWLLPLLIAAGYYVIVKVLTKIKVI